MKKLLFAVLLFSACDPGKYSIIDNISYKDVYKENLKEIFINGYLHGQIDCLNGKIIKGENDSIPNFYFEQIINLTLPPL